jgi:streptogramin lyase
VSPGAAGLEAGAPEVFVNRAGGGPDGIIIDDDDNLWVACNQSNEIMVLEPAQGRVIAKLGDFGGIDKGRRADRFSLVEQPCISGR